jgi:hypothetical protein
MLRRACLVVAICLLSAACDSDVVPVPDDWDEPAPAGPEARVDDCVRAGGGVPIARVRGGDPLSLASDGASLFHVDAAFSSALEAGAARTLTAIDLRPRRPGSLRLWAPDEPGISGLVRRRPRRWSSWRAARSGWSRVMLPFRDCRRPFTAFSVFAYDRRDDRILPPQKPAHAAKSRVIACREWAKTAGHVRLRRRRTTCR